MINIERYIERFAQFEKLVRGEEYLSNFSIFYLNKNLEITLIKNFPTSRCLPQHLSTTLNPQFYNLEFYIINLFIYIL